MGCCWISLARVILDLFVPDAPIDPAAVQQCALEFWRNEEAILQSQLELHVNLELRAAGNTQNSVIFYLEHKLKEVLEHVDQHSSSNVSHRKDITRLQAFWSEVFQIQTQVVATNKIEMLLRLLEQGDPSALTREQVIQESIAGFCHRMESVYPEFCDIFNPIKLALSYMRLGLRLACQTPSNLLQHQDSSIDHICAALIAFPSVQSTSMLSVSSEVIDVKGVAPFQRVLLNLSAIALERTIGVDMVAYIQTVEVSYDQAFRLWSIDRAREDSKEQESQSLYRHKAIDYDAANEEEVEEHEFLQLFPTFEDVMDGDSRSSSTSTKSLNLVLPAQIQVLVALHDSLFGHNQAAHDSNRVFSLVRMSALEALLLSQSTGLPDTMDSGSRVLQLELLRKRLSELQSGPISRAKYHFYSDANVLEVKKATVLVESLKHRLDTLIQEWPDQMVLQELRDRCGAILKLDLHSSVAHVLSALEQLLLHTQDWEIYANRDNTLKFHQQTLTSLIVEWRRLELSCWQSLLQTQALTFSEGTSESWFHLYDISIRGPLGNAQDSADALGQYLGQYATLLENFIRTSPLGQFNSRVELLQTFDAYIGLLAASKAGDQRITLHRVQRLLRSTTREYNRFIVQIGKSLSEQRVKLEKEIQAFIKLASWKDVNVHALKESSQRTHHNLYKIVRKFREVLRQPVSGHLQTIFAGETEQRPLESGLTRTVAPSVSPVFLSETLSTHPAHLANLDQTYQKFDFFLADRIRNVMRSPAPGVLDELASEIITTTKSLAAESVPKDLPVAKRNKLEKALLVRKRKAWSDLLKELKRGGLSANVKPDVLRNQRDPLWIKEQPILLAEATIPIAKVDLYLDRLQSTLPPLRASLSEHHSDITTRDLQRGVMLLESGFTHALDARSGCVFNSTRLLHF